MVRVKTTTAELSAKLEKGSLARVYLLLGEEAVVAEEAWSALRRAALSLPSPAGSEPVEPASSWNEIHLTAPEVTAAQVFEAACVLPFFGGRRLVRVTGVEEWPASELQAMARMVHRLPDSACLVLVAGKASTALVPLQKSVEERGVVVEATPLPVAELPRWLVQRAAQAGYRLELVAAQRMVEQLGDDLSALTTELEKVLAYAGAERTVGARHLSAVRSLSWTRVSEYRIFDLADALGEKKIGTALAILGELLESGRPPLAILATLAWHWRRLVAVSELLAAGVPLAQIGTRLSLRPTPLRRLAREAEHFPGELARLAFGELARAEREIKSGRLEGPAALQLLCVRIGRLGEQACLQAERTKVR